ncbi:MAG: DUF3106 domain-containing protein [Arenimonas sp.]
MRMMSDSNQFPSPPRSAALIAFLHGIEPRAWVFALSQSGDGQLAMAALQSALPNFLVRAQSQPLAEWPLQFWSCLLAQPLMLTELDPELDLARLTPGPRAALLLRLIAGLDVVHAARVLDVSPEAYQVALNHAVTHPDLDDAWMQDLRQQLHGQIHQMAPEQRQALAQLRERALSGHTEQNDMPGRAQGVRRARASWWAWGLLALLAVALVATFVWPFKSAIAPGQKEALPVEPVAAPPALTDTVIVTHPDYAQLAEPADAALAQRMALLSWLAAATPTAAEFASTAPSEDTLAAFEALPASEQKLLSSARAAWPSLDAATRSALAGNARDWRSRTPTQRGQLRHRLRQWNQQTAPDRARLRTPFLAWQGLSSFDRQRLRAAAARFDAMAPAEQQALRDQFAALPADTQRLWWLGPMLGQELAPIASLFAFMPEAERPELLLALRTLGAEARGDLVLLAPRLNEAQRQTLRRELLAAAPGQRAALIHRRLAQ